jgi:hypothetical protein
MHVGDIEGGHSWAHFELSSGWLTIEGFYISPQNYGDFKCYNAFISSLSRSIAGGKTSPIPSQNLRWAGRSNGVSP